MINTNINLGVAARLELNYENIHKINKLFKVKSVFIHKIGDFPIDYEERSECFDSCILDLLTGLKNKEEFKIKAANIAELKDDMGQLHLRRKIEYLDMDNANDKSMVSDYEESEDIYTNFDTNKLIFDFFYKFSNLDADFDEDNKTSYNTVSSLKSFTYCIKECIDYFKEFGIDEDQLFISNSNTLNI